MIQMIRYYGYSICFAGLSLYLLKNGVHYLSNQGWFWCPTDDKTIDFYRETIGDTVSTRYLLIFTMVPFLLTIIFTRFLASYWLNILLMVITKLLFPEPRPHFIQTCNPDPLKLTCSSAKSSYQLYKDGICRLNQSNDGSYFTQRDVLDSLRSFPSGHAQNGAFTMFIALHFVNRNNGLTSIQKIIFSLFWICNGLLMAISRITDNRHHWWDVLAGSIMGGLYSYFAIKYFLYQTNSKASKGVR
ncbi:PLPP1_2_3 [Lepeophtheirus salmonis]|uniref:PLPP1_2_3 n=1 Tax=Lepeophtheirus salmonis TaxID=72036 RepID=A0A7R8H6M0_LEPSM|nr:PLPP1_2_3 [Lepeophtheirus salmonis]CAF2904008.1 PLPP1_2_3 [Lepeophtheirus salmonis]